MVSPSSVVAHLVKLLVSVGCTRYLNNLYRAKRHVWSLRAFQIFLVHSIVGVLRFGTPFATSSTTTAKSFRSFYDWFSGVLDFVPLALVGTDILNGYEVDETIQVTLLSLGIAPLLFQLMIGSKQSQVRKYYILINITATLQLFAILLVGLRNGNYGVISFVTSYAFERFFVEEISYHYDVPYIDLAQYCFSFVEIFAALTLKEL